MKMTLEERKNRFIEKAKKVHSSENLDFSKVVYVGSKTDVIIIDHDLDKNGNEYGEFKVTPSNLLKGRSHPKRRGSKINKAKRSDFEELVKRFAKVHAGENLDYSKSVYVNMHTPILIIDHDLDRNGEEYGEYYQEPSSHLKGCGHKRKGIDKCASQNAMDTEGFIKRAKEIHGDRYDYSHVNYVGYRTPVEIICKKHGVFQQTPENHLEGKGCQKCGNHFSRYDEEIASVIESNGLKVIRHDKKVLDGKEIDILVPEKKIGIEFNGLKWHTDWFSGKGKEYHLGKTEEAIKNGYSLIQIFEDEYVGNKKLVLNKILYILGLSNDLKKIMARKCTILEIEKEECRAFMEKYHIQGFANSTIYLGAFYNGEMVAAMSFKKRGNGNEYDLTRYTSNDGYICQGVAGKLLSNFKRLYNPEKIVTFADRRWTIAYGSNMYDKLGFVFDSYIKPSYWYYNEKVQRNHRFHKFGFRKQKLSKKYGFPIEMTETEMVKELGYDRIWDCGLIKYVWKK